MLFESAPSPSLHPGSSSFGSLLTPNVGSGPYDRNPFSPDFHLLFENNNNNHEQTPPKFPQHKVISDNDDDDKHSQLLFSDVEFAHAQEFVDSDTEKSDLFSPSGTHSPSLDVDSFYSSFDEEATNCDIGSMDIEKWLTQAAFPSPPMDVNNSLSHKQALEQEEDPPWIGEECTVGDGSSSSFFDDNDNNTQTTLSSAWTSSAPTTPTDGLAPSSPSFVAKKEKDVPLKQTTTMKKKRGATLSTTERKMRKKYQNKTAAEKYRVKKKSEKMTVQERHSEILHTNKELKLELENMNYRVTQLKQLFLDILHMNPSSSKTATTTS